MRFMKCNCSYINFEYKFRFFLETFERKIFLVIYSKIFLSILTVLHTIYKRRGSWGMWGISHTSCIWLTISKNSEYGLNKIEFIISVKTFLFMINLINILTYSCRIYLINNTFYQVSHAHLSIYLLRSIFIDFHQLSDRHQI